MRTITYRSASLLVALLAPVLAAQQNGRPAAEQQGAGRERSASLLRLEQYLDWEDVQDPQLSPDGNSR